MTDSIPFVTDLAHPYTHWPYYTKRLACWWLLDAPRWQAPVILIGPDATPAWRLTPATFAWFWVAVDNLASRPNLTAEQRSAAEEAVNVLLDMDAWLTRCGLADDVRATRAKPVQPLAKPPVWTGLEYRKVDASFNEKFKKEEPAPMPTPTSARPVAPPKPKAVKPKSKPKPLAEATPGGMF